MAGLPKDDAFGGPVFFMRETFSYASTEQIEQFPKERTKSVISVAATAAVAVRRIRCCPK